MFTGLIEATGRLVERRPIAGGFRLQIRSPLADELTAGDSLAVNGVCLTVVTGAPHRIHTDVGPETARITTLGTITDDATVNLERPLRADARFGGHFVQGHVDAIGEIVGRRPDAAFEWLTVGFPRRLASFIVLKGSIAIDGIS